MDEPVRIGRYRLVERLARGGMADVWRATVDGEPEVSVAIKTLPATSRGEPSRERRLLDEARLGTRLTHANIVKTVGVGEEDHRAFVVMELLQGWTFAHLSAALGPLPVNLVMTLAEQLLAGLAHAHEATGEDGRKLNLVHRDIKPSNLFLTKAGVAKIIDFGIAAYKSPARTDTRTGTFKGSVAYASPEQVRGEPLDARSDLFSMALVLHQLLAGRPVFEQESDAAVISAILFGVIPPIRTHRPDVPAAVDDAICWALAKEPGLRPGSATEWSTKLLASSSPEERLDVSGVRAWADGHATALDARALASRGGTDELPPALTLVDRPEARRATGPQRVLWPRARRWAATVTALFIIGSGTGWWLRARNAAVAESQPLVPKPDVIVPAAAAIAEPPTPVIADPPAADAPVPVQTTRAPVPRSAPNRPTPPPVPASASKELGFLTVNTSSDWGKVILDGKAVGETPLYKLPVKAGVHQIEVLRSDGVKRSRRVIVTEGLAEKVVLSW